MKAAFPILIQNNQCEAIQRLPCMAHTLQLEEVQHKLKYEDVMHCIQDVQTRWNSLKKYSDFEKSPLIFIPRKYQLLALILFSQTGFTFSPSMDTTIKGGNNAIIAKLPYTAQTIRSWKKHTILFEDQLTTLDDLYAANWSSINRDPFHLQDKLPGRQPKWYKSYIDNHTISKNNKLLHPINISISRLPSHKIPKISADIHYRPSKEWTISWHAQTSSTLFGKTVEQVNDPFGTSCTLHTPYYRDLRPQCVFMKPTLHLHKISPHGKRFTNNYFHSPPFTKFVLLSSPIHTLKVTIYNIYINSIDIPRDPSHTNNLPLVHTPGPSNSYLVSINNIERLLFGCHSSIDALKSISHKFSTLNDFHFYTDGSVFDIGLSQCRPTCDILQRNFPHIYPQSPITCPSCNTELDSNHHILLCSKYTNDIISLLKSHRSSFTQFIFDKQSTKLSFTDIKTLIYNIPLFDESSINNPSNNPHLILFAHQLVPKALNDAITWLSHCDARNKWEKSINITKQSKKMKRPKSTSRTRINCSTASNRDTTSALVRQRLYASDLWFIWASSNFLHSGSWSHHRSVSLHHNFTIDFNSSLNIFIILM
ncbi:hypothetical protein C1645_815096 [Glomus cerebriforme]|uniref:Uncharacterized protein n=1 Tax=Glomus cerebriforme TaxID=658196 RepID=A0A397TEK7_9GLOM|nr:hypothetical protein C1645_815096 [Glomus cerebriforme]